MVGADNEADDILSLIGFGRWQIAQCIWLFLFYLAWSNMSLSIVIIGYVPEFACLQHNISDSGNFSTGDIEFDGQCSRFNSTTNSSQSCTDGYMYKDPKHSSIVSEWGLVCGQSFLSEMSQSAMTIGVTLGAVIFPQLSDRFGRRRIVLYSHAAFALISAATAFVPNIWVFIAARTLNGALLFGAGSISWVLTLELFIPKYRTMAALISNIAWAVSVCYIPMIGYLMDGKSWRHIQLLCSVFSVVWIGQLLTLCESIRWLLANGKRKEAMRVAKIAMRINRTDQASMEKLLTDHFHDIRPKVKHETTTYTSNDPVETRSETLFKPLTDTSTEKNQIQVTRFLTHPALRRVTLIMMLAWFTDSLTYFGLFMLSSTMSGSRYLNLFLNSVVEIPAAVILLPLSMRFGRRKLCVIYHTLGGFSLITAAILHVTTSGDVANIIQTCVVVFGKFCISTTLNIIYMYTPELYPTNVRSIGLGFSDIAGRIAGYIAPFSATVARAVPWVPACVFGVLCLLVAAVSVFLPETANKDLPQTLEDLELMTTGEKKHQKEEKHKTVELHYM